MGEEAVVGEAVGEETTTQRRGFWAKTSMRFFFENPGSPCPAEPGFSKLESNHDPKAKLLYDGYDMMDSHDMTIMIRWL